MKFKLYALALTISLVGISKTSSAQTTATASTSVVMLTPISVAKETDMNFGSVAVSAVSGTVNLDYANGRTVSGGVTLPAGSITQSAAVFTVTGEGSSQFSIAIPSNAITLTGSGNGAITVSNFADDLGATDFLVGGSKTIKIRGTLNVPANSAGGIYSNTNDLFVTLHYN